MGRKCRGSGDTAAIDGITLQRYADTNLIIGNMLVDRFTALTLPVSLVWDSTGLFNAIAYGLQIGDVVSGTDLWRNGSVIANIGSATPASDVLVINQGPVPLVVTTLNTATLCDPWLDCYNNPLSGGGPFTDDGIGGYPMIVPPFEGFNFILDIGSGSGLTVVDITSVPIPAAGWLLWAGLFGLFGMARHKA